MARICRGWLHGVDWHCVYADIRNRLHGLRNGKLSNYIPHIPTGARAAAFMHGAVCSALAQAPDKRTFLRVTVTQSWYGTSDSFDTAHQWIDKGSATSIGVPVIWSEMPRSRLYDANAKILFLTDFKELIGNHDFKRMSPRERYRISEKICLLYRHRVKRLWLPDQGEDGKAVGAWTHPEDIRRALAAWRDSEAALCETRGALKTFRATTARKRPAAAKEHKDAPPRKKARLA